MSSPVLVVHRSAHEIGGNCIEIEFDRHRLLLDAGSPLTSDGRADLEKEVPQSLDLTRPVEGVVISHPHQDHYGLLKVLPADWPVWCGAPTETLMKMTASIWGATLEQPFSTFSAFRPFDVGPFTITPCLTDHSAFDSHMLLVECGDRRMLYSGDFRRVGRKAGLFDRMMRDPPKDIDVLLLEGTTLGRAEAFPTESELESEFVSLFRRTPGRVFVTWSAQNIDRTVTIYRACKRTERMLVLDLYAVDVLERLSAFRDTLPRLSWPNLKAVITSSMKRLYEGPKRMNNPRFVEHCATSGHGCGAAKLQSDRDAVVMLRPSLYRDFTHKGVKIDSDDAWVFSMWSGYLKDDGYQTIQRAFDAAGATCEQIHTSGHASRGDLEQFARKIAPRYLVPIHSFDWDENIDSFPSVLRLSDGEVFEIP